MEEKIFTSLKFEKKNEKEENYFFLFHLKI